MAIQIQLRRDTAANWTAADPVLAQGELGIETDTNLAKLGDGLTAWTLLAYWPAGGIPVVTTAQRLALPMTAGLVVYDIQLFSLFQCDSVSWSQV